MKNRIIIITIFTLIGFIFCKANTYADHIVANIIQKYENDKSLKADIHISSSDVDIKGYIIMQDKCFTIITPDLKTWYNGKTQWSYSTQTEEVNITEPEEEELQTSNPYLAITSYKDNYKGKVLKSKKSNEYIVRFKPTTSDCDISEVQFSVDKNNWSINEIILITSEGEKFTTRITNSLYGEKYPESTFYFNKNQVPANTPLNDLR